jgi:uncharacterized damage-inducible protein DinB
MTQILSHHFHSMAHNNAWANYRLTKACMQLSQAEFVAPRTSFFPSIKATLNHNYTVDCFYLDALEREACDQPPHPNASSFFEVREPYDTCVDLSDAQAQVDRRLIVYCGQLTDEQLARHVTIVRPTKTQHETRTRLLAHLFQHQIHHRGQVHAMLSGTSVKPPQLDDFFCENDAPLRAEDFAALGWTEATVWG